MKSPLVSIKAILGSSPNPRLPSLKSHLHLLLDFNTIPEAQVQDAQVCGMRESLAVRPASEAEPQESLLPREDTELFELTVVEPFEPEAAPVQLPTLHQALPMSPATLSPVGVASNVAAGMAAGVAAGVAAFRHIFRSAVVHLGDPEGFSPLPEVDI